MARLATVLMNGATPTADGFTVFVSDARGAYATTPVPTEGANILVEAAAATTRKEDQFALTTALATTYYHSFEWEMAAFPVGGSVRFFVSNGAGFGIFVSTTGTLHAETSGGGTLGGTSAALAINTRYRIEWTLLTNSGAADDTFRLQVFRSKSAASVFDTTLLTAQTIATVAPGNAVLGANTVAHTSPWTCYFSRLIVNDSTGTTENTMPLAYMGPPAKPTPRTFQPVHRAAYR